MSNSRKIDDIVGVYLATYLALTPAKKASDPDSTSFEVLMG
jgi:hypothetical protein